MAEMRKVLPVGNWLSVVSAYDLTDVLHSRHPVLVINQDSETVDYVTDVFGKTETYRDSNGTVKDLIDVTHYYVVPNPPKMLEDGVWYDVNSVSIDELHPSKLYLLKGPRIEVFTAPPTAKTFGLYHMIMQLPKP